MIEKRTFGPFDVGRKQRRYYYSRQWWSFQSFDPTAATPCCVQTDCAVVIPMKLKVAKMVFFHLYSVHAIAVKSGGE